MCREIYDIINDMAEVLNASQKKKLQEVLINRLSENNTVDYLQTVYQAINNSCGEDSDYCKRYQNKPNNRLAESSVELPLREMGKKLGVEKVHPHKFRRTMADI